MHVQIACLLCSVDAATANMLLPIAQATIISAPILLRDQIRHGVRIVRDRRRGEGAPRDGCDIADDVPDEPAPEATDR